MYWLPKYSHNSHVSVLDCLADIFQGNTFPHQFPELHISFYFTFSLVSKHYRQFPSLPTVSSFPSGFQAFPTVSRLFHQFPGLPISFQAFLPVFKLSHHFPMCLCLIVCYPKLGVPAYLFIITDQQTIQYTANRNNLATFEKSRFDSEKFA